MSSIGAPKNGGHLLVDPDDTKVKVDEPETHRCLGLECAQEGKSLLQLTDGLFPLADVGGGADEGHQVAFIVEHRGASDLSEEGGPVPSRSRIIPAQDSPRSRRPMTSAAS